ncbi:MAG: peptide-methionine (R)-S-oxide reductase MsrB [Betaproteobacteria bacterium]|nr:peptide-methionine (R)-S-oxide reductase MsrB [Betaproteobacteria bacterium]
MTRRQLFNLLSAIGLGGATARTAAAPAAPAARSDRLELPAAEWRRRLTPAQYAVLRDEGTERPYTSPLNNEKRAGSYHCAGCELPLFSHESKFDSGTGWPSFHTALPGAVATRTDFKMILPRTEYHCARCDGHQGHVFDDGPRPSGKRYCNNGVALRFVAATA